MHIYRGQEIDINAPFVGPDGEQFGVGVLLTRPDKMAEYQIVEMPDKQQPVDIQPVVSGPVVVTMRQARLALLQAGLLAQVNTAIANMPGAAGDTARIEWEFSSTVERNRPLVQSLIGALGLTESQLDDLFRLAATL